MSHSILYSNLGVYRLAMTLLYGGKYKNRFLKACHLLREDEKKVTELCFGDIVVAEFCRAHHKDWLGIDITEAFVLHAQKHGFFALQRNIKEMDEIPVSDVCLMIGSLYHFANDLEQVFSKVLASTQRMIISESINNLSSRRDLFGWIARKASRVKDNPAQFRFTKNTLLEHCDVLGGKLGFQYSILNEDARDIILEIRK